MNQPLSPEETLDLFKNSNCFNETGYLDLEMFCVMLSKAFGADGVLDQSPQPREMYYLMITLLQEQAERLAAEPDFNESEMDMLKRWIQFQKLIDWTPTYFDVYPDRFRTLIHPAGYCQVQSYFINEIGYTLMQLPAPDTIGSYFDWVKPEWVHVHAFINGHHDLWWDSVRDFDRRHISRDRTSLLEAMHKSMHEGISYGEAQQNLALRHAAQHAALSRIDAAIDAGFFLEAVTLQECLISNCLFNYLKAKREGSSSGSFYEMLKTLNRKKSSLSSDHRPLFLALDNWRKSRNTAIHGFIKSHTEQQDSLESFTAFSETTAKEGHTLCRAVCEWYNDEAVNFLYTRFSPPNQDLRK